MRRAGLPLLCAGALLVSSCQAFGASRGLAVLLAVLTGVVAWLAHRGHARAGGSSTGNGTADTTGGDSTTGADSGSGSETTIGPTSSTTDLTDDGLTVGPCLSDEGPPPQTTSSTSTGDASSDDSENATGPCLSVEPEMGPCLCACETGRDGGEWAPALLLPVIARRRRKDSLEHLADRLPPDVVDRLRARIDPADRERP